MRFLAACPAVTLHGYIRGDEEVTNALEEADARFHRSSAITREGNDAIVDHADAGISGTHLTIGPEIAGTTDAELVDLYNGILESQERLLAAQRLARR
jgi:hypothetical protein